MHVIAAKAVAFGEALTPAFDDTSARWWPMPTRWQPTQAPRLRYRIRRHRTHLALVDLRAKGLKGNLSEQALGRANITCNKNGVPFDTEKPTVTSGIHVGGPAGPRGASVSLANSRPSAI